MNKNESVDLLNRHHIAAWIFMSMVLVIITGVFVAEFFQKPLSSVREINQYRILFKNDDLKQTRFITLKNKLGEFKFEKTDALFSWKIISPRNIIANQNPIQDIFTTLESIRIRKIHEYDPINASNFSLENPITEITLSPSADYAKATVIKFGLTNPIDGSSYIYHSQNKAIYHIDALETSFETLDLAKLVESRVFLFNPNKLHSFKLSKVIKAPDQTRTILELTRKEKDWVDQQNTTLISERVLELFKEFAAIRSPIILDQVDEARKKEVESYQENPSYFIEFKDIDENIHRYAISDLITQQWSDLKVEKRSYFFVFPDKQN